MRPFGNAHVWCSRVLLQVAPAMRRAGRVWDWIVPDRKSLIGLIVFLAVIYGVALELRRDIVFIQPLEIPKPLKEQGYSEHVAAYRLRDAVIYIAKEAGRPVDGGNKGDEFVTLLPSGERVSFVVPLATVTLESVLNMARFYLGLEEQRISGEFTCSDENCVNRNNIKLRLRLTRRFGQPRLVDLPEIGNKKIDDYIFEAARPLAEMLEPYTVAIYEYRRGNLREAEKIAMSLVNPTNPLRARGFNALGLVAASEGRYSDAENNYKKALESKPIRAHAQVYVNWGVVLRKQGNYDGAIEKFQAALGMDGSLADAYNSWGFALVRKGDLIGAESKYTEAISNNPEYALAYYNRAVLRRRKCNYSGAIQDFESALEIYPKYHLAYSGLAVSLKRSNASSKNHQIHNRIDRLYAYAFKLNPHSKVTLMNWGAFLLDIGEIKQAGEKFESALAIDRNYDRAHYYIGSIYEKEGKVKKALTAYEKAVTRKPKDDDDRRKLAQVHEARARLLGQIGRASEATAEQRKASNLRAEAKSTPECS